MTILVTGSAGHLGEALMRTLRAEGRPGIGLDVLPSPFTEAVGSICDCEFVRRHMAGVRIVFHAASLHKPHMATHASQSFAETNVSGTLSLLEASVDLGVKAFVYTSTTSAFGSALRPTPQQPATWITEDIRSIPRNIYGVTKQAAESLCELFHRTRGLPVVILRTSRFFPEVDDDPAVSDTYSLDNAQINELLYRRADIEDVVSAHLRAAERAAELGFGRYIISATTPFTPGDLPQLRIDAPAVVRRLFPDFDAHYAARRWRMFPSLDRVYVNELARAELNWRPTYDFRRAVDRLARGEDFRSDLARLVGSKGYHAETFEEGPYPVARPGD
jgi:UDP-glucose 4-epimerase